MKHPKEDPINGLSRVSDQKVVKKQKFLEFDFLQKGWIQNFDQGTPKKGTFVGPQIQKLQSIIYS